MLVLHSYAKNVLSLLLTKLSIYCLCNNQPQKMSTDDVICTTLHIGKFFERFWVPLNSPHFFALFDKNLKSTDQKLASVERFKVSKLKNILLRKSISKVSKLEKSLKIRSVVSLSTHSVAFNSATMEVK